MSAAHCAPRVLRTQVFLKQVQGVCKLPRIVALVQGCAAFATLQNPGMENRGRGMASRSPAFGCLFCGTSGATPASTLGLRTNGIACSGLSKREGLP